MTFKSRARRAGWLLVVAVFAFGIVSAVKPAPTDAYGLISSRSIMMSSSETSATNTIYKVGFTTTTNNQTIGSIVIRFCSNNPIIGDSCTAPSGFNVNKTTLSTAFVAPGTITSTGWTLQTAAVTSGGDNELLFTRGTPLASVAAGTTVVLDLGNGTTNGITNPNTTNTSFFARIMLFSANGTTIPAVANDDNAPPPSSNGANDAGGVALSTANVLNVTAKVQETLVFCVFTQANCAGGGNSIALGDSNGVLAATNQVYLDSSPKFRLASNALGGVIVRLKGDTLTSGAFTITPNGASCVPDSTTTSIEQFGIRVVTYGTGQYNGSATSSAGTNGTPFGGADDFSCLAGNHKFDPATTNTTYGQNFVRTLGATDESETNLELVAKAAGTTEAGVYTTKLQFIATATY